MARKKQTVVNFVMFDDSDYQISADVREGLEREFAAGLPVVLLSIQPCYHPPYKTISHNRYIVNINILYIYYNAL